MEFFLKGSAKFFDDFVDFLIVHFLFLLPDVLEIAADPLLKIGVDIAFDHKVVYEFDLCLVLNLCLMDVLNDDSNTIDTKSENSTC